MAISPSAADTVLAAFGGAKGKISFDSNLRLKLWPLGRARAMIEAAAAMADYFFPSIEDAEALSDAKGVDANLAWAHGLGAKNVFLKLGLSVGDSGHRRVRAVAHYGRQPRTHRGHGERRDRHVQCVRDRLLGGRHDDRFVYARYQLVRRGRDRRRGRIPPAHRHADGARGRRPRGGGAGRRRPTLSVKSAG